MEGVATDLAKSILEKLINVTIVQSRYICCFTCIAEDFEKEKETLKAKSTTVAEYVEVAKRRAEGTRSDVKLWQKQADELIKEDTQTRMTCFFGWCPNFKWQYIRGKELENKTKEIEKLMKSNFESVGITSDLPDVEYHSSRDYISFKSRELKYKELLDALTDDNNYMTGLQGMAGTGKTTLAKEVGKELKKTKMFDQVIDTTVSYTPDVKKIQDDIAGPLGLPLKDYSESDRPKILWSRLTNGEKILIILDDVWGDINFEDIGIPYKDNHNGCRILVTTRHQMICNLMGCDKIIQIELLPEEDAWILFKKHAGLSDSSSKSILDKGRKIAKECKGLPVAIAAIASSLKGQQRHEEWKVALKSLQKSTPLHGDDEIWGKIHKCLRYSYDNMKNEKAKRLFLLCSLFPEDEKLSVETLARFSVGAGLVGEIDDSYDQVRNEVVVAKNKLIDSCLLLKTEKGSLKMHDLVREVALLIAKEEIKAVNTSNKNQRLLVERASNLKYLLCEGKGMDVFSFRFDGSKLEIIIIYMDGDGDDSVVVPNSFFKNMTGLRVLQLSDKGKTWKPTNLALSLPQSIQSLTNIRSLFLERFELGNISILGSLQCLETLDLVDCLMDELPHEIAKLEKLKLLNLYWCEFRRNNPFKVIESCSSLEELYFLGRFSFRIDSSTMPQKINLPRLQRFRIIEGYLDFYKQNDSISNCLSVSEVDDFFSEATFKHLMQMAEFLQLFGLKEGWRNLIPEIIPIDYDGTNNLVELVLSSSQLYCLVDTNHIDSHVQNVFSKLVSLTLEQMKNLKELCSGPIPFELFKSLGKLYIRGCIHLQGILFRSKLILCNLKTLELSNCPMLVSLFPLSTAQSLVLLEDLSIFNCKQLKSIIANERTMEDLGEEIVGGDNDDKRCGSVFPNLKTLHISSCPQLHFILPVISARDVSKLEVISICDCFELKYIFSAYQHKHEEQDLYQEVKGVILVTLKEMELSGLPNFVDIFPECDQFISSSVKRSPSKDGSKAQIQSDPIKCNIFPWTRKYRHKLRSTKIPLDSKDQLHVCSLPSVHDSKVENKFGLNDAIGQQMNVRLQNIQLSDMTQMKCLFVGLTNYFTLQNLTELTIVRCEKMKVIFSASMLRCLPQLRNLGIHDCEELKQIIEEDTESQRISYFLSPKTFFPKLKVLVVERCNSLKCVFPISTSTELPKLEFLVIKEASMLEEVFGCENDIKVDIPNLKIAVFVRLPSLSPKIEFYIVKDRLVQNCPKLSLTSTLTRERFLETIYSGIEGLETNRFIERTLRDIFVELNEDSEAQETSNQNSTTKATKDIQIGTKVQATSGREWSSSQVMNTNQYIHASIVEHNQHKNSIESNGFISVETKNNEELEAEQEFVEKVPGLEIPSIAISPTDSKLIKRPCQSLLDVHLDDTHSHCLKETENTVSEKSLMATLSTYPKTSETSSEPLFTPPQKGSDVTTSSIDSESVSSLLDPLVTSKCKIDPQEHGEEQIAIPTFSNINIEPATTKDVTDGDLQETSKSAVTHSETNAPGFAVTKKYVQETCNQTPTAKAIEDVPIGTKLQAASGSESTSPQGIKRNFEKGSTSTFVETIASSAGLESDIDVEIIPEPTEEKEPTPQAKLMPKEEHGEGQIAVHSFSIVNTELATTNDVGVGDIQETSKSMVTHFETNAPENLSQITEDSSFASDVTRELEKLVSNKHLALENLSLLTNFLVKHPSVHLTDNAVSDRYKGFAYTSLAELLKFLQTHSVLDVLGSSHSQFEEVLEDVRRFGFNRHWLNGVERHAFFRRLQMSEDALQKLLDSKHALIQHLEDLKHQLEEQEAQVLEVRTTLSSTPLGY